MMMMMFLYQCGGSAASRYSNQEVLG